MDNQIFREPNVCIIDRKQHVRTFLGGILAELGCIICESAKGSDLAATLEAYQLDLVVLGLSGGEIEASAALKRLAIKKFGGGILLFGPTDSPMVVAMRELGEKLGLTMLPVLPTPFGSENLRNSVATLLPREAPDPKIDAAQALDAGWLELWYQPKIDAHTLALNGAEALIRMRHPHWGIVEPARFMPDGDDPHFRALSEFVISKAIADWHYFLVGHKRVDISINLSIPFMQNPASFEYLCQSLPDHQAFDGLVVEINSAEIIRDLSLARVIAKQARGHKIGIAIDNLGSEWPSLVRLDDFPFVKINVDREFVSGCADDGSKQAVCRKIVGLADGYGARTLAEGVQTRADFLTVREMGFDLIQGFLFGRPMPARKFARSMLCQSVTM
jgi:EAL domain-containing protein (putative c-di-GMP-specific phosphodiesterase class I)